MTTEAHSAIRSELGSQESLLWAGQPRRGIVLTSSDIMMVPFSIFWCGFMAVWYSGAMAQGANALFLAFGIPFVLVGAHLLLGRFFYDAWRRSNTIYGLTTERAIVISGGFRKQTKSLVLRTMSDVSLTERRGGVGTITLGPTHPMAQWYGGGGLPWATQELTPSFELIEDARAVFDRLREAQRAESRAV